MKKLLDVLYRHDYLTALGLGVALTALSYGLGVTLGWITGVNLLEAFAVFTSYVCTYLCVRQRRINYPIGAISSFAYFLLFWQADLLGSATLNAYLVIILVYGFFRWRSDTNTLPVSRVQLKWIPAYAGVTIVAYFLGSWIVTALGGQLAFWDVFILVGTILAQFLLDNKKLENWVIWFLVDVVAIYVYFSQGLQLAGFQYIFFTANTVYGFFAWYNSMKAGKSVEV